MKKKIIDIADKVINFKLIYSLIFITFCLKMVVIYG